MCFYNAGSETAPRVYSQSLEIQHVGRNKRVKNYYLLSSALDAYLL